MFCNFKVINYKNLSFVTLIFFSGISFKNICPRKELSPKLYNDTLIVKVIFGPTDSEWLHRSRRLGYLFDNIPTAPDIIFCIKGKHLYAHSEILKHAASLKSKFQEFLEIGTDHCRTCGN